MQFLLEAIATDDMSDTGEVEEWRVVWRPSDSMSLETFMDTQPKRAIQKSNTAPCTIEHDHDSPLSLQSHSMRTRLTACTSLRCNFDENEDHCRARYKINVCCEDGNTAVVYLQGDHIQHHRSDAPPSSPRAGTLTPAMKAYLDTALQELPTAAPAKLRDNIALKIRDGHLQGERPTLDKIQNYVKTWRRRHPELSGLMEPVEELVQSRLFDPTTFRNLPLEDSIYFADSEPNDDGTRTVRLGNGSDPNPFRVGATCRHMVEKYLAVQDHEDMTAVLHIDSTFGVVDAKYTFYVFGISDLRGGYHPLAYFCTSRRTSADIGWCLSRVKEVTLVYGTNFNPNWVMMDADDAQLNACDAHLESPILMCWFHVTQNVEKKLKQFRVNTTNSRQVWSDLYAMHYCRSHDQFLDTRESVLVRWNEMGTQDPAMRLFYDHFQREWTFPPSRFWRWQVFHTGKGVATTNNPLEQYHGWIKKSLKLNKNTTVFGLLQAMERGMGLYIRSDRSDFVNVCEVSPRMKRRYEKLKLLGMFQAEREEGDETHFYRIRQEGYEEALARFRDSGMVESVEALTRLGNKIKHRHECFNQPAQGWLVHTTRRSCDCNQWFKHGVCVHVIHACKIDLMECPGIPAPKRRFVNRTARTRGSIRRRTDSASQVGPRPPSPDM